MQQTMQTILLVEDSGDDAVLVKRAFRNANLANPIEVVTDGDRAVAYLSGEGEYVDRDRFPLPILMLLDLKLPRRSGFEVLEWLRAQPGIGRMRVVVLTSSKESADIDRAHEIGANSYLVKPVGLEQLIEMVRTLNLYWLVMSEPPRLDG